MSGVANQNQRIKTVAIYLPVWWETKQAWLGFGSYPETSLESARRKAESAREQIANGIDPSATRKHEKAENQQIIEAKIRLDAGLPLVNSFEYVTREWLEPTAHTVRDITYVMADRPARHGACLCARGHLGADL